MKKEQYETLPIKSFEIKFLKGKNKNIFLLLKMYFVLQNESTKNKNARVGAYIL